MLQSLSGDAYEDTAERVGDEQAEDELVARVRPRPGPNNVRRTLSCSTGAPRASAAGWNAGRICCVMAAAARSCQTTQSAPNTRPGYPAIFASRKRRTTTRPGSANARNRSHWRVRVVRRI